MFLTAAELEALTDRKTRPAQARVLKAKGIAFLPGPKVLRSVVERHGGHAEPTPDPQSPSFEWMQRKLHARDRTTQT